MQVVTGDPHDTHHGVGGQVVSIATHQLHNLLPAHVVLLSLSVDADHFLPELM